jgi:hypothetical protein
MSQERNAYFRDVIMRRNRLKKFILDFFFSTSSYPRLVLEVFIRKNFGERYFTIASAITVAVLLAVTPSVAHWVYNLFPHTYDSYEDFQATQSGAGIWSSYTTWYLFIAVFLVFSWKRMRETDRNPSVFDFGKFSLYSGDIHPMFFRVKLFGKKVNVRQVETFVEPAAFFIVGLMLAMMGQKLGYLLEWCSIFYSLGYIAAYKRGDDFVMDLIDEKIMNEEKLKVIVEGEENNARGVRFYMRRPTTREAREKLAEQMTYTASDAPTYAF